MTGWERTALAQRCAHDENWCFGMSRWGLFDRHSTAWWYRAAARAHRAAYALKAVVCMGLRRRGATGGWPDPDPVIVATDHTVRVHTFDGSGWDWDELTVAHGWRPRTWRYAIHRETSL